jgi:hypothetical protein
VPLALAIGTALIGTATLAVLARREGRSRSACSLALFDDCRGLFETCRIVPGADGFPYLDGMLAGRPVRLALIPDTLTLKRLPQLWLSVTLRQALPLEADLAILARPNGAEFFSIAQRLRARLDTPAELPPGLLAKGSDSGAQSHLNDLADLLGALFAAPKVKEVAVTRRGLRAVVQAREGKRGDYLLLRQSSFGADRLDPSAVLAIVDQLIGIEAALLPGPLAGSADRRTSALG